MATFAPPAAPTISTATVGVDAETGAALFAYLPMPDVAELRQAALGTAIGPSNYTTFGTGSGVAGHSVVMRYADRIVGLLNKITPGCAEPIDVFYGLVNRSNVHRYHRDGESCPSDACSVLGGTPWAAMVYLRGNMEGGHLRIPEYDVTLACDDGWGVFFPSAELLHGVTPMRQLAPGGYRYSILYGTLPGARECFSGGEPPSSPSWDSTFLRRLESTSRTGIAVPNAPN